MPKVVGSSRICCAACSGGIGSYVLATPLESELDDEAAEDWRLLELWGAVVEEASI
jgi:chemotaxis methyl-accepting protein methylase